MLGFRIVEQARAVIDSQHLNLLGSHMIDDAISPKEYLSDSCVFEFWNGLASVWKSAQSIDRQS
jgi:hypothetical protein